MSPFKKKNGPFLRLFPWVPCGNGLPLAQQKSRPLSCFSVHIKPMSFAKSTASSGQPSCGEWPKILGLFLLGLFVGVFFGVFFGVFCWCVFLCWGVFCWNILFIKQVSSSQCDVCIYIYIFAYILLVTFLGW